MIHDITSAELENPTLRALLDRGSEGYDQPYPTIVGEVVAWIEGCGYKYDLVLERRRGRNDPFQVDFFLPRFVIGFDYITETNECWWWEVRFHTDEGAALYKLWWSHLARPELVR